MIAVLALQSAALPPLSATPQDDAIVVTGQREGTLDLKRLLRARDAFRAGRATYAPTSTLQFQLARHEGFDPAGVRLMLRAGEQVIDVPVKPDGRFTLGEVPRGRWELVHNRGRRAVAVRARVFSGGASEADRPLGDLRLQCRVSWELMKGELSLFARGGFSAVGGCGSSRIAFYFRTTHPILEATMDDAGRRSTLPVSRMMGVRAPIADRTVPNAARVRLRFDTLTPPPAGPA